MIIFKGKYITLKGKMPIPEPFYNKLKANGIDVSMLVPMVSINMKSSYNAKLVRP
jgi:hypothetical protein